MVTAGVGGGDEAASCPSVALVDWLMVAVVDATVVAVTVLLVVLVVILLLLAAMGMVVKGIAWLCRPMWRWLRADKAGGGVRARCKGRSALAVNPWSALRVAGTAGI